MENGFKMRISRMFRASFGSCRTRNLSDVMEKAVSIPQKQQKNLHFQTIEPLSPKTQSFLSICRPKCPDSSTESVRFISRQKVSTRDSASLISANAKGHTCPPASPISPLNPFCKDCGSTSGENKKKDKKKKMKKKKKKKKKTHLKKSNCRRDTSLFSSSSQEDSQYYGGSYWFSSDEDEENEDEGEEGETDTLFSSRSLSSDSSGSRRRPRFKQHRSGSSNSRRNNRAAVTHVKGSHRHQEIDVLPLAGKVKGSFAVVKSSRDPYNDFRASMVEMIVEKRIFAPKDLEQLLQCFLSLNSHRHHGIIVEVFTEIWETLFSDCS